MRNLTGRRHVGGAIALLRIGLALFPGTISCSSSPSIAPPPSSVGQAQVSGGCGGSVEDYCRQRGGSCPTYDDSVREHRALCAQSERWSVAAVHCPGTYRSVSWREALLGGGEDYFNEEGRLIAVHHFTDYPAYCGSFNQRFGATPT